MIAAQAPAPAVPQPISYLSKIVQAPHLNENIYLQANIAFSLSNIVSNVLPAKLALIPVDGAAALAVVGASVDHELPDIEYLYIVTALLPNRYIKSSFELTSNTLVASGVTDQADDTVNCVDVLDVIVLTCQIPVPEVILAW